MVCDSYVCNDAACETTTCLKDYLENYVSETDAKPLWLILSGSQVFFMQLGFANLEAGSVSRRNVQNILFKNLMDACLGSVIWFCFGYSVSYGSGDVFGGGKLFLAQYEETTDWFFQWAFCVTASTIVSGAVAERMKLEAYFTYTIFITAFIYPAVVHWVWSPLGWASEFNDDASLPIADFAGSGVVHMVGGWSGLMGAFLVGPRPERFNEFSMKTWTAHSIPFQAFGTFVLWFGWYGFNCGSTLAVVGAMGTAALVAVTTTLAAASAGLTVCILGKFFYGKWNITLACNGLLAGLVSITAPCSVIYPELSIVIGFIGGIIFFGFSRLLLKLKIDDPLDAVAVHGACGFWGVVSVGFFANKKYLEKAGFANMAKLDFGQRLGHQTAVAFIITCWTLFTSGVMFYLIRITVGIRTEHGGDADGADVYEFGTTGYELRGDSSKQQVQLSETADTQGCEANVSPHNDL